MRTAEYINNTAYELSEKYGGYSSKIARLITEHLGVDGRTRVSNNTIEQIDELDWEYIFSEKYVYGARTVMMWDKEVGF